MTAQFRRFRTIVGSHLGIIAGSVIVFAIALNIVGGDISSQSDAVRKARFTQSRQAELANNLANLTMDQVHAKEYESKIEKLLPLEDDLLQFPQYIADVARTNSLRSSFHFQGNPIPGQETTAGYFAFTLSIEGSYTNIRNFLTAIEQNATQYLVTFDSFDLTSTGADTFRANFPGRVFFRNSP